uniref:Uncharacterized protein n=1 Tax=Compsopogon caeruleus TaxID=31354 RepID=A0A7S1XHU1_9RHOD
MIVDEVEATTTEELGAPTFLVKEGAVIVEKAATTENIDTQSSALKEEAMVVNGETMAATTENVDAQRSRVEEESQSPIPVERLTDAVRDVIRKLREEFCRDLDGDERHDTPVPEGEIMLLRERYMTLQNVRNEFQERAQRDKKDLEKLLLHWKASVYECNDEERAIAVINNRERMDSLESESQHELLSYEEAMGILRSISESDAVLYDNEVSEEKRFSTRLEVEALERKRMIKVLDESQRKKRLIEASFKRERNKLKNADTAVREVAKLVPTVQRAIDKSDMETAIAPQELELLKQLPLPLYLLGRTALICRSSVEDPENSSEESIVFLEAREGPFEDVGSGVGVQENKLYLRIGGSVSLHIAGFFLTFRYHPYLRVVSVVTNKSSINRFVDLMGPLDDGLESPNPSNSLLLNGKFRFRPERIDPGRVFRWANRLCGLEFVPSRDPSNADLGGEYNSSQHNMSSVERERSDSSRFLAFCSALDNLSRQQKALEDTLTLLARLEIPFVEESSDSVSPPTIQVVLKTWKEMKMPESTRMFEGELHAPNSRHPELGFPFAVSIEPCYPNRVPQWNLQCSNSTVVPVETINLLESAVNDSAWRCKPHLLLEQLNTIRCRLDYHLGQVKPHELQTDGSEPQAGDVRIEVAEPWAGT